MKQNETEALGGKDMVMKSLTVGLAPAIGCSLLAVIVLAHGFLQPSRTVMEIMLLPISAYVAGIGFMTVLFLREWNRLRAFDRREQTEIENREIEDKLPAIKVVYLTYQEEEANVYLTMGWVLLRVPVRQTDVDGQQPTYLLGWQGIAAAPRPRFDSKTRRFTV